MNEESKNVVIPAFDFIDLVVCFWIGVPAENSRGRLDNSGTCILL